MQSAIAVISLNLKRRRLQRGLSVSELARSAKVSKSTLSELERGKGNPAIETLWSLATVLNVPLAALFEDGSSAGITVTRLSEALVVSEGPGITLRHLRTRHGRGDLHLSLMDFAEGARRNAAAHGAGHIEHITVTDGCFDIGPDGASSVLGPGDCITFPADRPHHYYALEGPARFVGLSDYP